MKKLKRKIIKDIHNGHITSLYTFLERYIFTNEPLPKNFDSEFEDFSDKKLHKNFMIADRETTDKSLKEFSHWVKFLSVKEYIKTEPEKLNFKIHFVYKNIFLKKYVSYDPYFANNGFLQTKSFIIDQEKLKKYISNGYRTKEEFARYKKLLRERILFKIIPLITSLIILGLTIYIAFFSDKVKTNQKEMPEIKSDTTQTQ